VLFTFWRTHSYHLLDFSIAKSRHYQKLSFLIVSTFILPMQTLYFSPAFFVVEDLKKYQTSPFG